MIKNVNKTDKRIMKTRAALTRALIDLLQQQAYHEITVSSLCKEANISRATFYNNFETVDDILPYYFETRSVELQKIFQKNLLMNEGISFHDSYKNMIRQIVMLLNQEYYPIFRSIALRNDAGHINMVVEGFIENVVTDFLLEHAPRRSLNVPIEMVASALSGAITGALLYLYHHHDEYSEDDMCDVIENLTWSVFSAAYDTEIK